MQETPLQYYIRKAKELGLEGRIVARTLPENFEAKFEGKKLLFNQSYTSSRNSRKQCLDIFVGIEFHIEEVPTAIASVKDFKYKIDSDYLFGLYDREDDALIQLIVKRSRIEKAHVDEELRVPQDIFRIGGNYRPAIDYLLQLYINGIVERRRKK